MTVRTKNRPSEAERRFAARVQALYRETRPTAYQQGYEQGRDEVCSILEQVALRASLSPGASADNIEKVLRCILTKVARDG